MSRFYLSLAGRWLEHWAHGDVDLKLCNGSFCIVEVMFIHNGYSCGATTELHNSIGGGI